MNENKTSEKPACGCILFGGMTGGNHSRKCLARGRDKMNAEEVAADIEREKTEQRSEARAEFVGDLKEKLEAALPMVLGALDASKELRPLIPLKEIADELRSIFADDLAPFGALFKDAAAVMLWESSKARADVITRLFKDTGLPMDVCVQIVISAGVDLSNALKNIRTSESDKKK